MVTETIVPCSKGLWGRWHSQRCLRYIAAAFVLNSFLCKTTMIIYGQANVALRREARIPMTNIFEMVRVSAYPLTHTLACATVVSMMCGEMEMADVICQCENCHTQYARSEESVNSCCSAKLRQGVSCGYHQREC